MTKIYLIDKKKIDLDSHEWNRIFRDGTWSDRGINLFWRKKDDSFIFERWSNWAGEHDTAEIISRDDAIDFLLNQEHHPERSHDALETIGAKIEEY